MERLLLVLFAIIILCLIFYTLFVTIWDQRRLNLTTGPTGPTGQCLGNPEAVTFATTYNNTNHSGSPLAELDLTNSQAIANIAFSDTGIGLTNNNYIKIVQAQSGTQLKLAVNNGAPFPNNRQNYVYCTSCIEGGDTCSGGRCPNNGRPLLTNFNGTPFYYVNGSVYPYVNLLIDDRYNVFVYPQS